MPRNRPTQLLPPMILSEYFLVCMTIKLHIGDQYQEQHFSLNWEIDYCYGPKNSVKYQANKIYLDRCCLSPGVHTLICRNDARFFGWGDSFIEILGQRYCDDFVGYKGLRKVVVEGKFEYKFS